MSNELNPVVVSAVKTWEQGVELMEKLFAVTQPGAVFSEPITSEDYTVITASEVSVGMGFGYGMGGGTDTGSAEGEATSESGPRDEGGGGGGGGGMSSGRPVAVISIGPGGVRVEPVVDTAKIGVALFTTLGSMLMMLGKMRKASRGSR
ncbi:MAG: hypothetical protein MAG451_01780 [Anaerolineales bacterium]|nr:hypothetical protein [Anaerolineales bacterium]